VIKLTALDYTVCYREPRIKPTAAIVYTGNEVQTKADPLSPSYAEREHIRPFRKHSVFDVGRRCCL